MNVPTVYCHSCSAELGHLIAYTSDILGTNYQLGKFIKHTTPDPRYPVQSVFQSSSTAQYENFVVNSAASGIVEFDGKGRRNIVWVAGRDTGFRFENGRLVQPQDAVKVVLSTATGLIHAYPENSTTFNSLRCARCDRPVVQ